jgi:hypothetical protein
MSIYTFGFLIVTLSLAVCAFCIYWDYRERQIRGRDD